MTQTGKTAQGKAGQRVALIMAGTGVFWILATALGAEYQWPQRVRGIFDLAALAGFGFALFKTYHLWRARQDDKGE